MTNKENGAILRTVSQIKSLGPWKEFGQAEATKPMKKPWVGCSWKEKSWSGRKPSRKLETSKSQKVLV